MEHILHSIHEHINTIHPLSTGEFAAFSSIFKPISIKKKERFSVVGKQETKIGILLNGIIRAYVIDKKGNEFNKHLFTPYSTVGGFSSLITKEKNKLEYQALTSCNLLIANYNDLLELYDIYPNLERLARISVEHLFVTKEKREIELVTLNATERYLVFRNENPTIEQEIQLYHIASYLGITPTQLSRIRKSLL